MLRLHNLFIAVFVAAVAADEGVPVLGIHGKSVRIPCDIQVAANPVVEWSDMVYTSDSNPSVIFRSQNNPNFEIESSHQNRESYDVSSDFALTIDRLDLDQDPGMYTCRSVVGSTVHEKQYYLTVGDLPKCSGNVKLREGEKTTLQCDMSYSGQHPVLQWFQGGEPIGSADEYDLRLARKVLSLTSAHSHDQTQFTCRMSLGDLTKECSLVLNVTYLVREMRLVPEKEKYRVGDELKCVAKGNPTPSVTVLPQSGHVKTGPGWQSFTIGQNLEGQRLNMQCIASNSIGSEMETLSSNYTVQISVGSRKSHTTTTHMTPPVEEHQTVHHHARQTTSGAMKQTRHGGHHRKHHSTPAPPPVINKEEKEEAEAEKEREEEFNNGQHPVRNPVTQRTNTVYQSDVRKIEAKEKHESKTENTPGAKPVQGKVNNAGETQNLCLSSLILLFVFSLALTVL